jgi:hypothetical protein
MTLKFMRNLFLSITILSVFAWTQSPVLNSYNLQLTGALILLYFGSKFLFRDTSHPFFLATIILIAIVLLLILSTGGINSPIFFVLYFLLFAIALLLNPQQAAIASFLLVSIFLWQNYQNLSSPLIIDLFTLVLVTPLAMVFSNSYLKYLQSVGKISVLKESIKDEQTDSLLGSQQLQNLLLLPLSTLSLTSLSISIPEVKPTPFPSSYLINSRSSKRI